MAKKQIVTDRDIIEAWKKGAKTIDIEKNAIITPAAKDSAKTKNIIFVPKQSDGPKSIYNTNMGKLVISLGCDHAGFKMKEMIKKFLLEKNHDIIDVGTNSEEPVDFPDFAYPAALAVKEKRADFGIIIDGAGVASAIVANKLPGIRAACCTNEFCARITREHNNANILTLGSRVIGDELAKSIITAFLSSKFLEGKYLKRVEKVRDIENKFLK